MPELTPPTPLKAKRSTTTSSRRRRRPARHPSSARPPEAPEATPDQPAAESRATLPQPPEPPADDMSARLERLGGEPAPVITPEEFARLQNAGQVHIDAMGRVRTARRASQADAGVTLRKRRAWY
ncbi:MAG: hypothetical protein HND48_26850 [Chloroflexi bacterium]|nr:hypothetical protein [Chloroflexota bacterium]